MQPDVDCGGGADTRVTSIAQSIRFSYILGIVALRIHSYCINFITVKLPRNKSELAATWHQYRLSLDMCGETSSDAGTLWIRNPGRTNLGQANTIRVIYCRVCREFCDTVSHTRVVVTLKSLRRQAQLGPCSSCHHLYKGIVGLLKQPVLKIRRDSMIDDESDKEQDAMSQEGLFDELCVAYQIDPNFECPMLMGGWNISCLCNYKPCRHEDYHKTFDVFSISMFLSE